MLSWMKLPNIQAHFLQIDWVWDFFALTILHGNGFPLGLFIQLSKSVLIFLVHSSFQRNETEILLNDKSLL